MTHNKQDTTTQRLWTMNATQITNPEPQACSRYILRVCITEKPKPTRVKGEATFFVQRGAHLGALIKCGTQLSPFSLEQCTSRSYDKPPRFTQQGVQSICVDAVLSIHILASLRGERLARTPGPGSNNLLRNERSTGGALQEQKKGRRKEGTHRSQWPDHSTEIHRCSSQSLRLDGRTPTWEERPPTHSQPKPQKPARPSTAKTRAKKQLVNGGLF
jgi:hypothetical protein